ncbi:MAG: DUF4349 domain-containing protein [Actinomycetia bacterium]|nr:DUF4349 domain-containing protein [Actinomycetes bacterium]
MKKVLITLITVVFLLAGCSAGGSPSMAPAHDLVDNAVPQDRDSSAGGGAAQGMAETDGADPATDVDVTSAYLVREAELGIKVEDIMAAAGQVRDIAAGAGGAVVSESFGENDYGYRGSVEEYGSLTISVPSESLEATLTELSEIGEVRTRSSHSEDVADEYIDVEARIETLRASIERMRELMDQTTDIEHIISLERALSDRQADLDALQARLNSLDSRIAMSPITVELTTSDDLAFSNDPGVGGALSDAWRAFTHSAAALLTTIAALLPWLLLAAPVVLLLMWLSRARSRRSIRSAPATVQPTSEEGPTPEP